LLGEWPEEEVEEMSLTVPKDTLSGRFHKEVYILSIPTNRAYEVPAYFGYGDWNECPGPEEHVGIWRYWYEKYGAKIIVITSDTIECTVERPPTTREEALALAREQFFYCADIVTQGVQTVSALAACLIKSKYWFFWWD
jgi:hypothetical protein